MSRLLSVNELEKITNIPSSTIRRYLRNHKELIQTERKGNLHFVYESALPIIESIRQLYESGKNHTEITTFLQCESIDSEIHAPNIVMDQPEQHSPEEGDQVAVNELLVAVQARVEAIEKKQMKLLEDLMKQVKRVEESKEVAVKLLERQLAVKDVTISELEGRIRGYEIVNTSKEVAATRMEEANLGGLRRSEPIIEKKSLYDRIFKPAKVVQKNA